MRKRIISKREVIEMIEKYIEQQLHELNFIETYHSPGASYSMGAIEELRYLKSEIEESFK